MTIGMARDGYTVVLTTPRDGVGGLAVGDSATRSYGQSYDVLLRLMDEPTAASAYHPGHLTACLLLLELLAWATDVGHPVGTPGVRGLALSLARVGAGTNPGGVHDDGTPHTSDDDAAQFVTGVDPAVTGLLVDAVAAADSPRQPRTGPFTPSTWADDAPLWAAQAASTDLWWMDAGMYARDTFWNVSRGATADDLLETVAVMFTPPDAALLRAGLGAYELLGWPAVDAAFPIPAVDADE